MNQKNVEKEAPQLVCVGHSNDVTCLAFSPDGKILASGSYDHSIILWDVAAGEMLRLVQQPDSIHRIVFRPDGKMLVAIWFGGMMFWNIETDAITQKRDYDDRVAISPDNRTLAVVASDCAITLRSLPSGRVKRRLVCQTEQIDAIAFSPNGVLFASLGYRRPKKNRYVYEAILWDPRTGRRKQTLTADGSPEQWLHFSPDSRTLMVLRPGAVDLWDTTTGDKLPPPPWDNTDVSVDSDALAFSPDDSMGAVGEEKGDVRVWEVPTGETRWRHSAHQGWVRAVAFSPDGKLLASGGNDHLIRLWDVDTGKCVGTLGRPAVEISSVAFTPDGRFLASASDDRCLRVWSAETGRLQWSRADQVGERSVVLALPDGKRIASTNPTLKFWDVDSGTLLQTLSGAGGRTVALSPDGTLLAGGVGNTSNVLCWTVCADGTRVPWDAGRQIDIWDIETDRLLQSLFDEDQSGVNTVAYSPDGKTLASGHLWGKPGYGEVKLWDVPSGKLSRVLSTDKGDWDGATCVAFSPDGRFLVSGHVWWQMRVWDVKSGRLKRTIGAGGDDVTSLAFSPDGRLMAAGTAYDEKIGLWRMPRGTLQRVLIGHTGALRKVAFSPEGKKVASGAADNTIRIWEARSGRLVATWMVLTPEHPQTGSGEWVVYTPEGYFTCSAGAETWLRWRVGSAIYPFETYANRYRQPDRIRHSLNLAPRMGS